MNVYWRGSAPPLSFAASPETPKFNSQMNILDYFVNVNRIITSV